MNDNYVKIHYSGKDYIGQINSIESEWVRARSITDAHTETFLQYYKVSLYEKDTWCLIDDIFIKSFSEIKPYNEEVKTLEQEENKTD